MANGWKEVYPLVCEFLGEEYAFDTVRRFDWLEPALVKVNNKRVRADVDKLRELCADRIRPKAA